MARRKPALCGLRQRLYEGLRERLDDIYLNGHPEQRLPGNLNVSFAYVQSESFLMSPEGHCGALVWFGVFVRVHEPSYVLRAIGVDDTLASASIRFGLGRSTTAEEIDTVIDAVADKGRTPAGSGTGTMTSVRQELRRGEKAVCTPD